MNQNFRLLFAVTLYQSLYIFFGILLMCSWYCYVIAANPSLWHQPVLNARFVIHLWVREIRDNNAFHMCSVFSLI